jgi:5-methylcytosine-specific restriction enzyme subunit McrC
VILESKALADPDDIAGKIPIRNLWHMFLYAWNKLELQPRFNTTIESAPKPVLLFAMLLATCLERRVRRGIPRAYVSNAGEINVVRGRIDVVRSARAESFARGRVFCHFDTFSVDTTRNRLIKMTVRRLVESPDLRTSNDAVVGLRSRLLHCLADMAGIQLVPIRREAFRHESPGRNDSDDALILAICELLFLASMPTTNGGQHRLMTADRDQRLLRLIFELFVWRFLERRLTPLGWRVEHNKRLEWPARGESPGLRQYLPSMELDVRLTSPSGERIIVVDTKFKNIIANGQYGSRFVSSDIYQIFTYVHSQSEFQKPPNEAVLLYPAIDQNISEFVQLPTMKLRFETIDLKRPWQTIEDALLEIFKEDSVSV